MMERSYIGWFVLMWVWGLVVGVLTREEVREMIRECKKYLDQLRDYDLGKWRPDPSDLSIINGGRRKRKKKG